MDFSCPRLKDRSRKLLLAGKAYPQCCCAPLAAGKSAKAPGSNQTRTGGGVHIVHDGVGILAAQDIDRFDASGPKIAAKAEFLFEPQIQAGIRGETQGIRRTDELLLKIDGAEGIPRPILEEITQLCSPDMRRSPAPGKQPVRGIPGHGPALLRRVKDGT